MPSKLNHAMDYIEENMTDGLKAKTVADVISLPERFLNNIFFALTGTSLTEYIKGRMFSEANRKLIKGATVTDVAFEYGYSSVESFSRAFKKWSGYLPSDVSKLSLLQVTPKISFQISATTAAPLSCRIESGKDMYFIGISGVVVHSAKEIPEDHFALVERLFPDMWQELLTIQKSDPGDLPKGVIFGYNNGPGQSEGAASEKFVGILSSAPYSGSQFKSFLIPACEWAVFNDCGTLDELRENFWLRIYSEWAPSAGYYELNSFAFTRTWPAREPGRFYNEIWVPVAPIQ